MLVNTEPVTSAMIASWKGALDTLGDNGCKGAAAASPTPTPSPTATAQPSATASAAAGSKVTIRAGVAPSTGCHDQ